MDVPWPTPAAHTDYLTLASRARTAGLEQKPYSSFGLINPGLEHARAGHIAVLVAQRMRLAHAPSQLHIIVAQLGKHIEGCDVIGVVVHDALLAADLADRPYRHAADLSDAFRDRVG